MSANQLIAKALSTTSEEEAIACLRMARKKGLKADVAPAASVAKVDEERDGEWAKLVTQARTERDKYKRMLNEQIYATTKLKLELNDVPFKMIMAAIAATTISSLFWLIVGSH